MLKSVLDSIKRQYEKGNLQLEQIQSLLDGGDITQAEFDYITGKYQ